MSLEPGTKLGRYEIRSRLGAGGMGEVHLAYDHDLEREVAVKVISETDASSDLVRRFLQEARASSALSHPNVATVYEIGTHGEQRFIAMELVQGETLRAMMRRGPLPEPDITSLATQIASGLAAAHEAGIIHRDIKPENIMVRRDGLAKILDFGLAKLREVNEDQATALRTGTGVTMGTLAYMSPEQLSGGTVTPASDVFSLGVVLYEMIGRTRPFDGPTSSEIAAAILTKTPPPAGSNPKLSAVILKALEKKPEARYATAGEMLEDLRMITGPPGLVAEPRTRRSRTPLAVAAAVIVILAISTAVWLKTRAEQRDRAREAITVAEKHLASHNYPAAWETATAALEILPAEQRLRDVVAKSSERVTFESTPAGATVYLERFEPPAPRMRAGVTPLTIPNLPHADYIVIFEKEGYAAARRPLPQFPVLVRGEITPVRPAAVAVTLVEASRVPENMDAVEGGEYTLKGWQRMSNAPVQLDDFLIDRFEVTNAEFEEFVRAGAYRIPSLWKTLPFEQVDSFRDTTGLPGPRGWAGGTPPSGLAKHPVTGVSWHEASAFAAWKGKQLPTIYQWEKAARFPATRGFASTFPWGLLGEGAVGSTERMNFNGRGTMPADGMPFGIGPFGSHHMAGNVSEWTRNPLSPGYATRGGSWNDALYSFGKTAALPAMYASSEVGFRCVKPLEGKGENQGEFALEPSGFVPKYEPVGDEEFAKLAARYEYVRTPPKARVVRRVDQGDWIKEEIAYEVDGQTVPAHLYLPKNFRRPLQVVHFSPAGDVYSGWRALDQSIELTMAPVIRGGRAVFAVVMPGFIGRPRSPGFTAPDSRSDEYTDFTARQVRELRQGIDYLASRNDLDLARLSFVAVSAGSWEGIVLAALEDRYRSVMLIGSGISSEEITDTPAANRINFAPRIRGPKLMLQGRYDDSAPLDSVARPLFDILSEPKRLEIFDGGHVPKSEIRVRMITGWLDETVGKVE